MDAITFYTSDPANRGLAGLMLALGQNMKRHVQARPLAELPPPDELHRQRLRCERVELLGLLRTPGTNQTAIQQRLAEIDQVLGQEGGAPAC